MHYFTADTHFGDESIIKICKRPFEDVKQMNEALIGNYNKVVRNGDECYFIGDFAQAYSMSFGDLKDIVHSLNGDKFLILGNHDTYTPFQYLELGFKNVFPWISLHEDMGRNYTLFHDPSFAICCPNDISLCGHVHGLFRDLYPSKRVINIGVDIWGYTPVSEEFLDRFNNTINYR